MLWDHFVLKTSSVNVIWFGKMTMTLGKSSNNKALFVLGVYWNGNYFFSVRLRGNTLHCTDTLSWREEYREVWMYCIMHSERYSSWNSDAGGRKLWLKAFWLCTKKRKYELQTNWRNYLFHIIIVLCMTLCEYSLLPAVCARVAVHNNYYLIII